jgi:hypothetical protein
MPCAHASLNAAAIRTLRRGDDSGTVAVSGKASERQSMPWTVESGCALSQSHCGRGVERDDNFFAGLQDWVYEA